MNKTAGLVQLIRPVNCIIIGFAVLVGAAVTQRSLAFETATLTTMGYGFLTAFTFLAAANTINDYYDRKIDAVNEPKRPIPRGIIKPKEALSYAFILSAVGFIAAYLVNLQSLTLAVVAWLLFMYYATKGKKTGILGNFVVSICVAIPFVYGSLIVKETASGVLSSIIIVFAGMAFFSTVGREITKGIVDVEGDKLEDVKTVAVLYGPEKAAVSAAVFYLVAVLLSFFPWLLKEVSLWYLPFIALADSGFIFSSVSLLHDSSKENARKVKNRARIWMVIGLLAFVAGMLR